MPKNTLYVPPAKKIYQTPTIKKLGNVKTLTLKVGSNSDGFGGTFV
ncbi:hypothetical protein M0L20_24020 [Spirosoma sp. RP8]|uniref:Lasso RiPP family leader peptide-containing protein n=1 Tax=Spirosoma liriopis TaxID=2937440 RepID=A0ABT0HS07_9BACT|nr:hypothetical protein [Spirosoma liriopis]MCK8494959.1 hypothetical protein [Spirosoma liriopis]